MKRIVILGRAVVVAGLLAGCASGVSKTAPLAFPPPEATPPPPPVASAPPRDPKDQCGAHDLAYLVGRPKSEIPVPVDPALRRVACANCPVTMDFNPRRLNIFFDTETGLVKEVKCG